MSSSATSLKIWEVGDPIALHRTLLGLTYFSLYRIPAEERNLDALVSHLSEALERAKSSRDANAVLLNQYAQMVSIMLKQFYEYKSKHVSDVAAWHRSYRAQLAEARAENTRLREQMWEMQEHAGKANELLREFRKKYDEDESRWERRVSGVATRQEVRFWRRMAMPDVADDDPGAWSDDDDLIDGAEKQRLAELERKNEEEQLAAQAAAAEASMEVGPLDSLPPHAPIPPISVMGGVPMQREDSVPTAAPIPPPRPTSAASSTGSTGGQA